MEDEKEGRLKDNNERKSYPEYKNLSVCACRCWDSDAVYHIFYSYASMKLNRNAKSVATVGMYVQFSLFSGIKYPGNCVS